MMPSTARQMRFWHTANPKKSGESKREVGFSHAEKEKKKSTLSGESKKSPIFSLDQGFFVF